MGRGIAVMLWGVLAAQAQQAARTGPGQISVSVKGDDGSILSGASVFLKRTLAPGALPRQSTTWSATANAAGAATFDQLPLGQYTLCAQAVSLKWLNPCEWGTERPAVVVSAAQSKVNTTVVLKRGAIVTIRVDDASQLLAQNAGKTPGAHLLLGVRSDAGVFHTASLMAQDTTGRAYSVTIPFNTKANVVVASGFFRLVDGAGAPFAASGAATVPVAVASGQEPPSLRLRIDGRR